MEKTSRSFLNYLEKLNPLRFKENNVLRLSNMGGSCSVGPISTENQPDSIAVEPLSRLRSTDEPHKTAWPNDETVQSSSTNSRASNYRASPMNNDELNQSTRSANGQNGDKKHHLQRMKCPAPEKVCKVLCCLLLSVVVFISGFIARITLHIQLWHLSPPTNSTEKPKLGKLGGLLRQRIIERENCTHVVDASVDETWVWALFLVVIAPYLFATLSTFFRIMFKSNKPLKWTVTIPCIFIEVCHAIGVALMAFLILPAFDPVSASVTYLGVMMIPSIVGFYDNMKNCESRRGRKWVSIILIIFGSIMHGLGISAIAFYLRDTSLLVYIIASFLSSIRYWENYIQMGNETSKNRLMRFKYELHVAKTKNTFVANICKILTTFIVVIAIYSIKANNYMAGLNALFNGGLETIKTFGNTMMTFGRNDECLGNIPFLVAALNICCGYICYKTAKTVCVIKCQIIGFSIPMMLIPIASTFTIVGFLTEPNILQFDSNNLLFPDWILQDIDKLGVKVPELIFAFVSFLLSILAITFRVWNTNGFKDGATSRIFVAPFYCGIFTELSLLLNRRQYDEEYDGWERINCKRKERLRNSKIYTCATLWHESETEMSHLLRSLFRLDKRRVENKFREEGLQNENVEKNVQDNGNNRPNGNAEESEFCSCWTGNCGDKTNKIPDDEDLREGFDFEGHLFFDDALVEKDNGTEFNSYVKTLVNVVHTVGSDVYNQKIKQKQGKTYLTPYGAKIEWELPGGTKLTAHLKDKRRVKVKKRWSQIMYMHYIMGWKLKETFTELERCRLNNLAPNRNEVESEHETKVKTNIEEENLAHSTEQRSIVINNGINPQQSVQRTEEQIKLSKAEKQDITENTFILTLDGDVEFKPDAVMGLLRRMKKSQLVGSACGRIHPVGRGPMIWYQKFEYAISHWLQKATEHVIGCVLCGPGCFSLFRATAILNPNVLQTYSEVATEPHQVLQYDQGEDRWLCTLLLKQGWKIEYCAESDAYTFGPTGFYEFFGQRRRWVPSTLANCYEIITDCKNITENNENISYLYIAYQVFLMVSTLLTPGTIFMLIVGALIIGFDSIPSWVILTLNIVPVGIFALMTIFTTKERQLQFAAILSSLYVVVMVIALIGIIRDALQEGICSVTTIAVIFETSVIFLSAVLHPKECLCLLSGLVYFLAIPATSMLMFFYSIANLNENSWGTREQPSTSNDTEKGMGKGYVFSFGNFFKCICCPNSNNGQNDSTTSNYSNEGEQGIEMSIINDETNVKTAELRIEPKKNHANSIRNGGYDYKMTIDKNTQSIGEREKHFWIGIIDKHLKPDYPNRSNESENTDNSSDGEQERKDMNKKLTDLRNNASVLVFLLNAILVTIMFALTEVNAFKDLVIYVKHSDECEFKIDPIAILFIVNFGILLLIQFFSMLYHRTSTLMHILANTVIFESDETKRRKMLDKIIQRMVSPENPAPLQHVTRTDKEHEKLDENRKMEHDEQEYPSLNDMALQNLGIIRTNSTAQQETEFIEKMLNRSIKAWKDLITTSKIKSKWKRAAEKVLAQKRANERRNDDYM